MVKALKKSERRKSKTMNRHISLQASEDGLLPYGSPDGEDQSGLGAVPASRSASPASEAEQLTLGIFGQNGSGLSKSAALSRSLANRLRVVADTLGSTLFRLTWNELATPSGWLFPLLRASALPICGTAFTSWPTPHAGPQNET